MKRFTHPRNWIFFTVLFVLVGTAVVFAPAPSLATTATNNLAVTATVLNTCTVGSSTLAFGNYSGSAMPATATITLTCTSGTSETIALDTGANGAKVSGVSRAMASGTNYLGYEIYQDSTHSTVWSTTATPASTSGTGAAQTFTAYGNIPGNQLAVPSGSYTDTVGITVTY